MKMKALLIGILCLVFVFGAVACSNNTANEPAPANNTKAVEKEPAPAAEEPKKEELEEVEIRFTWWGDTKRHEKYNAIVDEFEKAYPHITVAREFGEWVDYWDKLATQSAGGNAPDVVGMHMTQVANYASRGALVDLQPYVDSGVLDQSDFPKPVTNSGVIDGKLVMIAQGVTMSGWVYNSGLLERLKVEPPSFGWTWDEFAAKAKEVTTAFNEKGHWGATDMGGDVTSLIYYSRGLGKNLFTEEGKLGIDQQDMVNWLTIWDNLRKEGSVPDAATTSEYRTAPLEQNLFISGKVAFHALPFNQIPNYQNYIKDGEVRALRKQVNPDGKNGEFIEGAYLAVTSGSKNPEAAAQFINFFVNNENAIRIFQLEQGAVGSTKMNELVKTLINPAQQRAVGAIEETLAFAETAPLPPKGQGEVATALLAANESVGFGQSSVEAAAAEFVKAAEAILAK